MLKFKFILQNLNNEGEFNLIYKIDAGEKYFFNDFQLNLPEDYDKMILKKLKNILKKLKG